MLRENALKAYDKEGDRQREKVIREFVLVFNQKPDSIDVDKKEIKCDDLTFFYIRRWYGSYDYYYFYIQTNTGRTEVINLEHLGRLIKEGRV